MEHIPGLNQYCYNLHKIRQNILLNIKNIPGWRTDRKIVVIECDDWGGIRMPSRNVFNHLVGRGLKVGASRFNLYDTLETEADLEQLFDTLNSVKDKHNKPAVMTPVTNMANPDFGKIKSCGFSEYHFEAFTKTLKKYYPGEDVFKLWREGMAAGIFVPELHGREHISVQIWMEKLREGNKDLLLAFDNGFTALDISGIPLPANGFRPEFYFTSAEQKPFLVNSIKEAVELYRRIFSISPRVFVPGNGVFHPDFDDVVACAGVKFLYVNHKMAYPGNEGRA